MFESVAGRDTSRRRANALKSAGLALLLALAAVMWLWKPWKSGAPTLHAARLPGMAIDAPPVKLREGGYARGRIVGSTRADATMFEVAWHPGAAPEVSTTDATVREIANVAIKRSWSGANPSITTHEVKIGGHPGIRLQARAGAQAMDIALATCSDRDVSVFVQGADADAIADHMIASFTCTPDPSRDVFASEVAFAASQSWQRRPHTQVVDGPGDLDVRYIAFTSHGDGTVADHVERYVDPSYHLNTPSTNHGDKVLWTGTRLVGDKPIAIAVLAWRCEDHRIAMAVVESATNQPLDEGVAFAATGHCVPPDHSNE